MFYSVIFNDYVAIMTYEVMTYQKSKLYRINFIFLQLPTLAYSYMHLQISEAN